MILVGERLATVPGALSAAPDPGRHHRCPARLGPAPGGGARCARDRLPAQPAARRPSGRRRRRPRRPRHRVGHHRPARDRPRRRRDHRGRRLRRAHRAGGRPGSTPPTCPTPRAAAAAIEKAGFVVSLEVRASAVSHAADVVFPVAPVAEKAGMFVDWEGRVRPFEKVLRESHALPDLRVLSGIADEMGVRLGFRTVERGPRRDAGPRCLGRRAGRHARPVTALATPARVDRADDAVRAGDAGSCCSTTAGCSTATTTSRPPRVRRSRWCRPRRSTRSASPPASTSR